MEGLGKVCTKCNREKIWDEFGKNKGKIDGHESWCKECISRHKKKKYILNKKAERQKAKEESGCRSSFSGEISPQLIDGFCKIFSKIYRELSYEQEKQV